MLTYNSYHSELKCLARENLLSREIIALIPRSNIWRWKHEPAEKYKSFDLNLKTSQDYELIRSTQKRKILVLNEGSCFIDSEEDKIVAVQDN